MPEVEDYLVGILVLVGLNAATNALAIPAANYQTPALVAGVVVLTALFGATGYAVAWASSERA